MKKILIATTFLFSLQAQASCDLTGIAVPNSEELMEICGEDHGCTGIIVSSVLSAFFKGVNDKENIYTYKMKPLTKSKQELLDAQIAQIDSIDSKSMSYEERNRKFAYTYFLTHKIILDMYYNGVASTQKEVDKVSACMPKNKSKSAGEPIPRKNIFHASK